MNAEIDETGCLTVTPGNGLEKYALRKWRDDWFDKKAALRIDLGQKEGLGELINNKFDTK